MSSAMEMSVTLEGTAYPVAIKVGDLVAFERKYGTSYQEVAETPRIEYVCFLAWHACVRAGHTADDFDTFLNKVDDFDMGDDEEGEATAAPLEPSSDS